MKKHDLGSDKKYEVFNLYKWIQNERDTGNKNVTTSDIIGKIESLLKIKLQKKRICSHNSNKNNEFHCKNDNQNRLSNDKNKYLLSNAIINGLNILPILNNTINKYKRPYTGVIKKKSHRLSKIHRKSLNSAITLSSNQSSNVTSISNSSNTSNIPSPSNSSNYDNDTALDNNFGINNTLDENTHVERLSSLSSLIEYITGLINQKENTCFLMFWKKLDDILDNQKYNNIDQSHNKNDDILEQLRDILLLTGLSLKYPTWSGEQLCNIIKRIYVNNDDVVIEEIEDLESIFSKQKTYMYDLLQVSDIIYQTFLNTLNNKKDNSLSNDKKENEVLDDVENLKMITYGLNKIDLFDYKRSNLIHKENDLVTALENDIMDDSFLFMNNFSTANCSNSINKQLRQIQIFTPTTASEPDNNYITPRSIINKNHENPFDEFNSHEVKHLFTTEKERVKNSLLFYNNYINEFIYNIDNANIVEWINIEKCCKYVQNQVTGYIDKNTRRKKMNNFWRLFRYIGIFIFIMYIFYNINTGYFNDVLQKNCNKEITSLGDIIGKINPIIMNNSCILDSYEYQNDQSKICGIIGDSSILNECFTKIKNQL